MTICVLYRDASPSYLAVGSWEEAGRVAWRHAQETHRDLLGLLLAEGQPDQASTGTPSDLPISRRTLT